MSEPVVRAIHALEKAIGRMNKEQTKAMADMNAPLSRLPEISETQTRQTIEAVYDGVKAQVLVAIAQQRGLLGARESQISEELEEVDRLRRSAEAQTQAMQDKMLPQLEEISENARQMVEQLDRPVMDLGRRVFTESVFLPYTEKVVPHWRLQVGVGIGSQQMRKMTFERGYKRIERRVEDYLQEVEELQATAEDLAYDLDLPELMKIPLCVVSYEEGGKGQAVIYVAPALDSNKKTVVSALPWLGPMIKTKFTNLKNKIMGQMQELKGIPNWANPRTNKE